MKSALRWATWGLCAISTFLLLAWAMGGLVFAQQVQQRLLFIGNSYTYGNAPTSLTESTEKLLEEGVAAWTDVFSVRVAAGGYRWIQHLKDADGSLGDKTLRKLLVTSQDPTHAWDAVILQEQSQIPGLSMQDRYWLESAKALEGLHTLIAAKKAKTVLLMTWGRRLGDSTFPSMYPDFKAMQKRLQLGYEAYAARLVKMGIGSVYLAPVGLAWERIYDDLLAAGSKPTADGSRFSNLYTADGSHPSQSGSVLAACVIYATLIGRDPRLLSWYPPSSLPAAERAYLREVAYRVVVEEPFGKFPYPWAFPWSRYVWPRDVSVKGLAISSISSHHTLELKQAVSKLDALSLGVLHTGQTTPGAGRLYLETGAKLQATALNVGLDGEGEVRLRGGELTSERLVIAQEASSTGLLRLLGGTLTSKTVELGKGKGRFVFAGGRLQLESFGGALVQEGGTFAVETQGTTTQVKGDYTLGPKATLEVKAAPGSALAMQVDGKAKLEGTLTCVLDSALERGKEVTLDILKAKELTLETSFQVQAPQGAQAQTRLEEKDGQKLLRLVLKLPATEQNAETRDETQQEPTETTEQSPHESTPEQDEAPQETTTNTEPPRPESAERRASPDASQDTPPQDATPQETTPIPEAPTPSGCCTQTAPHNAWMFWVVLVLLALFRRREPHHDGAQKE